MLGYLNWISILGYDFQSYPNYQKISLNILTYPYISYHILSYPKISSGANSQMWLKAGLWWGNASRFAKCQDTRGINVGKLSAINDAISIEKAVSTSQPVKLDVGELLRLQQLIIRHGESAGMLTRTEFETSKFCAEEKLKKRTSYSLISKIKRLAFVIDNIHAETIREMDLLISECSKSEISDYDLWTKDDGKQ